MGRGPTKRLRRSIDDPMTRRPRSQYRSTTAHRVSTTTHTKDNVDLALKKGPLHIPGFRYDPVTGKYYSTSSMVPGQAPAGDGQGEGAASRAGATASDGLGQHAVRGGKEHETTRQRQGDHASDILRAVRSRQAKGPRAWDIGPLLVPRLQAQVHSTDTAFQVYDVAPIVTEQAVATNIQGGCVCVLRKEDYASSHIYLSPSVMFMVVVITPSWYTMVTTRSYPCVMDARSDSAGRVHLVAGSLHGNQDVYHYTIYPSDQGDDGQGRGPDGFLPWNGSQLRVHSTRLARSGRLSAAQAGTQGISYTVENEPRSPRSARLVKVILAPAPKPLQWIHSPLLHNTHCTIRQINNTVASGTATILLVACGAKGIYMWDFRSGDKLIALRDQRASRTRTTSRALGRNSPVGKFGAVVDLCTPLSWQSSFIESHAHGPMYRTDYRQPSSPVVEWEANVNEAGRFRIALDDSERYLASGGSDNAVRVWDVHSGRIIKTLPGSRRTGSLAWVTSSQSSHPLALVRGAYYRDVQWHIDPLVVPLAPYVIRPDAPSFFQSFVTPAWAAAGQHQWTTIGTAAPMLTNRTDQSNTITTPWRCAGDVIPPG